ncbi:MAG: hypothetical protein HY710_04675 [Candidatus Latescibacteria bacterium]|nr:hypothetical protein [Candidatus Latescibacterota bacterium]
MTQRLRKVKKSFRQANPGSRSPPSATHGRDDGAERGPPHYEGEGISTSRSQDRVTG